MSDAEGRAALSEAPSREERYRTLFESSPVSIWEEDFSAVKAALDALRAAGVVDLAAHLRRHPDVVRRCAEAVRVVDVNAATVALHGAGSKAELLRGLLETFTPESFRTFERELVGLWNGETSMVSDAVVRTLAGEPRDVTVCFSVCPGHEETLSRVFVSLIDVTTQRRAAEETRRAERRYREIFENASDVMYVLEVTEDGRFRNLDVNPAFERSTGLTAAQVIGKVQEEVVPAETAGIVNASFRRCVQGGAPIQEERDLELPAGRRSYDTTLIPVRDPAGRVRRVIGISRDLTGHKRSLEEIEDLYNNAPCGYHSLDADGTFVRINDVELHWLGYRRDELVRKVRFPDLLTGPSLELFRRAFPAFKERGAVRDLEFELIRKDGTILPAMVSATAVRDAAGRFLMSRSTVVDLSERRRVEEQLRQAQKLEAVARLAGGVAHDFNNVLTVIMGSTADLLETAPEGPLRAEVEEIDAAAQRAVALTRQLLTFSRRQPVEPKVLDLDQVSAGMDKMLRRIIGEDIELVVSSDGGVHRVWADPGQLEQVLLNLAVNARDAMPRGGRLTIETRAVPSGDERLDGLAPGDHVLVAVRDTGTGMEPAVLGHLFEPFFTTKERGKGTGLGLSTVYGIVKQAGGEVRVETAPGQGSTFLVYLPAVSGAAEPVPPAPEREAFPRGHETVLVVEDDPQVRGLVVRCLRSLGYAVREAPDGEEALRLAAGADRLDLLVTDAVMPRMGGLELADRVRAIRPETAVLLVSGYAPDGARPPPDALLAFLPKPFTPALLVRRVRELLDRRASG